MVSKQGRKTYLVTGGAGFIGSHVSDALIQAGHDVLVIDDLSTGQVKNLDKVIDHPNFHFVRASISDQIVMDRLGSQSDIIIHLAAAVGVSFVVEHPVQTIRTNVNGTEAVLETALRYNCPVMIASTSEVYGKGSKIPFAEDDDILLGPSSKSRWGYAASKLVDEFLGLSYQREFGLPVLIFRLFNTVGPRQVGRYGMVIPRFVQQALLGKSITVYGDGQQQRCFCDVRDVVRALLSLAETPDAFGQVYNIGNNEEVTIEALAQRIKTIVGSSSEIVFIPYEQAYAPGFEDMQRRVPSTDRIEATIGWHAEHSLDDILKGVIAYQQSRLD